MVVRALLIAVIAVAKLSVVLFVLGAQAAVVAGVAAGLAVLIVGQGARSARRG